MSPTSGLRPICVTRTVEYTTDTLHVLFLDLFFKSEVAKHKALLFMTMWLHQYLVKLVAIS